MLAWGGGGLVHYRGCRSRSGDVPFTTTTQQPLSFDFDLFLGAVIQVVPVVQNDRHARRLALQSGRIDDILAAGEVRPIARAEFAGSDHPPHVEERMLRVWAEVDVRPPDGRGVLLAGLSWRSQRKVHRSRYAMTT